MPREGLAGLDDKPRPGPKPKYDAGDRPAHPGGAGTAAAGGLRALDRPADRRRRSAMSTSSRSGASCATQKIDLDGRKSWCESDDAEFAAKAADVVGLYMAPPENAIVICVDEKPSIQALERAQGYLKLPNGRALTGHSHDYKRHGTTTLFAALDVATGKVTAAHKKRRRRVEFLDFMDDIVAALSGQGNPCRPRQPQHPQAQERALAQASSQRPLPLHADPGFLAQPGRDLVLHPGRQVPARRLLHLGRPTQAAHRCLHRSLQRQRQALRLDQGQGPPAPLQRPPYQPIVIPGTSWRRVRGAGTKRGRDV